MLGYDASALLYGMSSWTGDAEVFVKRFNPETHTRDYTIDLEVHEPGGPYERPAPLVEEAPQPTPEPAPAPVAEVPVTAVASNCMSCHTNKEDLKSLAVEKEVKSEKTSGEG
jgi:hypothetical protein